MSISLSLEWNGKENCDNSLCLTKVYLCYAVEPPNTEQALKWLYKASEGGNIRAQYQLALCLHRAGGNRSNIREAVGTLFIFSTTIFNYK
jgi:hypothetical protein